MRATSAILRVLHLGKFFPPHVGGMESYLSDLVEAQQAQGVEAFVLVHGTPLPQDPPWICRVPVQFQALYAPVAMGYRRALRQTIERFKPDVLHLHMPNTSVFWALTLPSARALPWVVHWHSDVLVSTRRRALTWAYRVYRPLEQAVLAQARRIIATSPPYLTASEPLHRWQVKCTAVALGSKPPEALRHSPTSGPWTPGPLRVLSLGRLAHYKGFDTLIRAVADLPEVELLIAGDGEDRQRLLALIQQLMNKAGRHTTPNIRMLGSVDESDKHALLSSCDVFALASCERTEAFGMVVLEAMAHGKPCLVSLLQGSGLPWLVNSSQAGRLAPVGDVPAWQQELRWMADHPAQRVALGEAGRQAFESRFTAAASAQAVQREYRRALGMAAEPRTDGATLIVIPARNEARTIGDLLRRLNQAGHHHVVVVDDLSTDGTGDIARREGAIVLRPVLGLGAWGGMQTGIRYGLQQGYQTVVTMDADGQHEVSELPLLLAAQHDAKGQKVDVVIGAHPERASRLRHIAWAWFRGLTGLNVTDLTSGFRCYRAPALPILASSQATLLDYQDIGTLLLLRHAGLNVVEVPVSMNPRIDGISRIFNSWFSVARYMLVTTAMCLSRWGRIRFDSRD